MMNISNIEHHKKFTATYKGFKAVIDYRIDEDWFCVLYYDKADFLNKNVHKATSEQSIIRTIKEDINKLHSIHNF